MEDGCCREGEVKHISEFLAEEKASIKINKSPFSLEKSVNGQNDGGLQLDNMQVATFTGNMTHLNVI